MVSVYERCEGVWVFSSWIMFSLLTQSFWVVVSLSLMMGPKYKVPYSRLVVPIRLHPALLVDSVVKAIVVSIRRGIIDVFIVVILGTYNMSALFLQLFRSIGPLLLLHLLPHQRVLHQLLFLFLALPLSRTAYMHLLLARILRHLPKLSRVY